MELRIAAIRRDEIFSPNHIENDELILKKTGDYLQKLGCEVLYYNECEIHNKVPNEKVIFSMARSQSAIDVLTGLEDEGIIVLNSPRSIPACYRENVIKALDKIGAPIPKTVQIDTSSPDKSLLAEIPGNKQWIKTNKHTIHKEDITLTYNAPERLDIIKEYSRRGIEKVIVQEFISGDEIKFYKVKNSEFFHWQYRNGDRNKFDPICLMDYAAAAADELNLYFYGGDAIIDSEGKIFIIDINDWPSFAPKRDEAASSIAKVIYEAAAAKYSQKFTQEYAQKY